MKKEIFIIDDDSIYRLIISKMIKNLDASVLIRECGNGQIGLLGLEDPESSKHKIVVLLDINMPVMDGWVFLDEIEKRDFYNLPQIDIYMVSSSVDESDKVKAKKYGFLKGFYHKPLSSVNIKAFIGTD
jgi:CheY-like chemotaxis protein